MKIYIISFSYNFALFFSIISCIEQKKICYNNFYLLNYYCNNENINKTNKKLFTKKYYDSTTDELINYLNYIKNNIKNYRKIKKVFPSYNSAKTTKEILHRNMTLKELYSIDFVDDLAHEWKEGASYYEQGILIAGEFMESHTGEDRNYGDAAAEVTDRLSQSDLMKNIRW